MADVKKGRPKGAANVQDSAEATPSRCPLCGSTNREPYESKQVQPHAGVRPDGTAYTHVVRRRTRCSDCATPRIDFAYENDAGENE